MVPQAMGTQRKRHLVPSLTRSLLAIVCFVPLSSPVAVGQQTGNQAAPTNQQAQPQANAAPQRPFPPLSQQEQAKLNQVLLGWQQQSQSTKTLECDFERWHFDLLAAPAGIHAHKAKGSIKYAKPDKGLFRVDSIMFYKGMKDGKPQYGPEPNKYGEYWVCNGSELIEYDRDAKKCNVTSLPPEMQGQHIQNGPLPFVFNLDAEEILQRYWVKLEESPEPNTYLVVAWPKRQEDRAQYKLVQVILDQSFQPKGMRMFAPNFHIKLAPQWDHYQFNQVKRNAIGAGIQKFMGNFIPKQPPAGWQVTRQNLTSPRVAQGQDGKSQSAPQSPQRQ
jgi:TIGR03009 family protein